MRRPTRRGLKASGALLAFLLLPGLAFGQTAILQGGNYPAGHLPMYSNPTFSQPIVVDSGPASGGGPGVGVSEFNQTNRGSGGQTSGGPFANTGTGPLSTHFCLTDNPTSTGLYRYLCLDANAQGGGLLAYGAVGTTALPLSFNINGTAYQFPFSTSGVVGPGTTVVGNVATWNNTVGTLLADGGAPIGTSGAAIPLLNGNNTYSGTSTFSGSMFLNSSVTISSAGATFSGSSSGSTVLKAAATASGTLTLPAATDTLVGQNTTDTLTNKSLTSPTLTGTPVTPTAAPGTSTTQVASTAFVAAAVSATTIHVQNFTANGTYTPTAHLIYSIIECWGAGGGGGGVSSASANDTAASGGGGAGSYSRKIASASAVGASQVVTIGAAGAGGTAGANNGSNGTDTSVGSLCVGKGGNGGISAGNGGAGGVSGGLGGGAGTGDVTSTGQPGMSTASAVGLTTVVVTSGAGGSSMVGGGGRGAATATSVAGENATGKAAGGAGATSFNAGGAQAGGAGTGGFVTITEFCSQ